MSKLTAYTRHQNVTVKAPVLNLKLTTDQADQLLATLQSGTNTPTADEVVTALADFIAAN